ncbi:aminotransferase class I/II-fold pyridoxal phosphate-dependent enzyme [bacterium]|nr:aminotransferase class I/II-fold pyridoxal phosphate-dependent enzyme [bacterium]
MEKIAISTVAQEIGSYPIAELIEKRARLEREGVKTYNFAPGDDALPVSPLILNALRNSLPPTSFYPLVRGTEELQEAISNYLSRRFSVTVPKNGILPVTGSKEGIYHLPSLLIDHTSTRRKVLGPALAYPPYIKGTIAVNGEYLGLRGPDEAPYHFELADVPPETLKDTALAYLNFPHNPTGVGCSLEYLQRQLQVAQEYGFLLVSDECYADVYFGDSPPPSLLELTQEGVLVFHSLSKRSGVTGYRSGFVAGDPEYIDGYARLRNSIGTALPEPIALASTVAWNDDEHVRERREVFSEVRKRAIKFFNELSLEFLTTEATFYLWGKALEGLSGNEYADALQKKGIFVSPASFFGEGFDEWFRISLVLSLEKTEEAFSLWREVHNELKQKRR